MNKSFTLFQRFYFVMLTMALMAGVCSAQAPVAKVDLNFTGRQEAETNEPGYTAWIVKAVEADSMTVNGIAVKFTFKGAGTNLVTDWNKAGIQAPYYARLVNDGITVKDGNAGGQIEMRIKGLPAGNHTLLAYHNGVQNPATNSYSPMDIFVNGNLEVDNLKPTIRVTKTADAQSSYLSFTAQENKDVVILFAPDILAEGEAGKTLLRNVIINGFEINTTNAVKQSKTPVPSNRDEHVEAIGSSLKLSWTKGDGVLSHDIYFGTDSLAVASANRSSTLYKGNQSKEDTTYQVNGLYSMLNYYWRVDEVSAGETVYKGEAWRFRIAQLAFPDAEGYGRFAIGGRGGKVVEVTNLNDSGPGSFREAITNNVGPRTIVFAVSGVINLESRLVLNQPYVTVAGQTAPGKGICIKGAPFGITANDAIVRHIRVRVGAGPTYDGMGLTGANHSIMDHCSISWTIDEAFSSRGAKNITLQRTLISEALNVAGHQNYPAGSAHGYAATISGDVGSFHHNLLAHCYGRNWSLGGGLDGSGYLSGRLDITNNVVYNWGTRSTDGGAMEVNFVNNYYKPGAGTTYFYAYNAQHEGVGLGTQRCYFNGNVMPGYFDENNQTAGRRISGQVDYETYVNAPFFPSKITVQSAREAYKRVLSDVGCAQPVFDDHDIRMINETLTGTYLAKGSVSGKAGFPDHQSDVGGYESYPEVQRAENWDTDHDGLPDWWEEIHSLNPRSPVGNFADSNMDEDNDGFTNLENYLDWMANPHYSSKNNEKVTVDLKTLSRGYTASPSFLVSDNVNGQASLNAGIVEFTPSDAGLGSFTFTVTDSEGSSMIRKVNMVSGVDLTLPVSLLSFEAQRKNASEVLLKWKTSQEVNNDHFEVQRRFSDSDAFIKTGSLVKSKASNGSSSATLNYEFKDFNSSPINTYYRLVQKDKDGKATSSEIRVVEGVNAANFNIWPVPNNGKFSVQVSNLSKPCLLKIFDVSGRVIGSYKIANNVVEKVSIANPGMYLLKFVSAEEAEALFVSKVIVN